jgi:hypothetical protein
VHINRPQSVWRGPGQWLREVMNWLNSALQAKKIV